MRRERKIALVILFSLIYCSGISANNFFEDQFSSTSKTFLGAKSGSNLSDRTVKVGSYKKKNGKTVKAHKRSKRKKK